MKELFLCFLLIYIMILVLRFYLTQSYYKKNIAVIKSKDMENYLNLEEVTIFQPILSGDKFLEEKLSYIYDNLDEAQLIWALNKNDREAERIVNKIIYKNPKKNVYIKKCDDSPFNENPKVFKILIVASISVLLLRTPFGYLLASKGKSSYNLMAASISVITLLVLIKPIIYNFGLEGVAWLSFINLLFIGIFQMISYFYLVYRDSKL